MTFQHWFGRPLPAAAPAGIGLRAIIERDGYLDFVPNRKSFRDPLPDDFKTWLDTVAIPALAEYVKRHVYSLLSSSDTTGVYSQQSADQRFEIEACSNQSCGYLYIGAWVRPVPAEQEAAQQVQPA